MIECIDGCQCFSELKRSDIESGWRFFSGTEDQADFDDLQNSIAYNLDTIASYISGA
jgi:hypothetical protein